MWWKPQSRVSPMIGRLHAQGALFSASPCIPSAVLADRKLAGTRRQDFPRTVTTNTFPCVEIEFALHDRRPQLSLPSYAYVQTKVPQPSLLLLSWPAAPFDVGLASLLSWRAVPFGAGQASQQRICSSLHFHILRQGLYPSLSALWVWSEEHLQIAGVRSRVAGRNRGMDLNRCRKEKF